MLLLHEQYIQFIMAWWLSWLERRPVTAEVVGSNPIRVAKKKSGNRLLFCVNKNLKIKPIRFEAGWGGIPLRIKTGIVFGRCS